MAAVNQAQIIIKRSKKGGHAAHHGGAWKVAYADFVTAMMAFFLLLWLLNATTEVQKQGISDYFSPATVSSRTGGAGGLLGGRTIATPGAMHERTAAPSLSVAMEPTSGATEGKAEEEGGASTGAEASEDSKTKAQKALRNAENKAQEVLRKEEEDRFKKAMADLNKAIKADPELAGMEDQVKLELTKQGLKVQIVDKEGRPMFPSASARMFERTRHLLATVASVIRDLPNKIEISGHTDSKPFRGGSKRYGNWELSSDRANSTRRALVEFGLADDRVSRIMGRAARDPLVKDDPESPRNRRISLMLLHKVKPPPVKAKAKPAKAKTKAKPANKAGSKAKKAPDRLRRDWSGPRVR